MTHRPARSIDRLLRDYAERHAPRDLAELVEVFLPLARRLAGRYASEWNRDDLEQIAAYGLVKALRGFDPARGVAFVSFATPTILGELRRSFRREGWPAHVPRALQERAAAVEAGREALERAGRPATEQALAARLELSAAEVREVLELLGNRRALSLAAPSPDDASRTVGDRLGSRDGGYARAEHRVALREAVAALSELQRVVVGLRFVEDLRHREIAERIGIHERRVQSALETGLARLGVIVAHRSSVREPRRGTPVPAP